VEAFGLKRFNDNTLRARQGFEWVLRKVHEKQQQLDKILSPQRTNTPNMA
jgi:hypothetical protein